MTSQPTGTVTFLFTDIEGSTKRWEQYPRRRKLPLLVMTTSYAPR
jgi:class 3 adenylate cyclase